MKMEEIYDSIKTDFRNELIQVVTMTQQPLETAKISGYSQMEKKFI